MKLSIVIPNYNGAKLLKKNLPRVSHAVEQAEIIIVDDASSDNSIEEIKKISQKVTIIKKDKNEGFAIACNTGVEVAKGDVVILLNTDVYPDLNFLNPLVTHFNNPNLFAVGSLEIVSDKNRGKSIASFKKGMFIHNQAQDRKPGPTLWAFGAASAYDRKKWIELGGMDSLFRPAYWEDIDLCWRAWKRGWLVLFEPKSKVYHQPESTNISVFGKNKIKVISNKNQLLFIWKNISDMSYIVNHLVWLPINLCKAILSGDVPFLLGYLKALLQLPEVIKKRKWKNSNIQYTDREVLNLFSTHKQ